ncbi:uncharacterized protein G2W53_037793 [Senna tora]|uniref:Uncharacterized protein n=1 Tax=Senna tora TaxID=362788 RepID=A0A834SKZ0_9FABA|nr:uncharacterized protein G2W53_037793 [Senna tora]
MEGPSVRIVQSVVKERKMMKMKTMGEKEGKQEMHLHLVPLPSLTLEILRRIDYKLKEEKSAGANADKPYILAPT